MSSLVSSSSVSFPLTDANQSSVPHPRPSYLPFRRISAPSAPLMVHRQSIASMASFDSLPEEAGNSHGVIPSPGKPRRSGSRPTSFEVSRKSNKRRTFNDAKDTKRRRIINEFYETERSYVDGLELIYSHFLTPIIASLDTPKQLLDRNELTSVFSNFIDIWNLHRSFFSSLSAHLQTLSSTGTHEPPTPLSPILLSHFPYLSLYTPFVTSFDTALSSYGSLISSKPEFASFISRQEADPHCGKLKLRDWLLTVVQRCPRYLLLLKDLISCTCTEDPEHAKLTSVHTLVAKITTSLNTSLHTHAQTLSLLAIQRSTPNLPFQLISPGRSLLKRGPLLHLQGSSARDREFLLFSDCFMWLENQDKTPSDVFAERWSSSSSPSRPSIIRTRSRSDAQLQDVKALRTPSPRRAQSKSNLFSPPTKAKQRYASSGTEERWQYKGHVELVDIEVVVSPPQESGGETRLEILSPQISFAVYADSESERDEWAEALRNAKASLFMSLNAINPNSTLTSSSSTNHLRRTLQALPHLPEEADKRPKRGRVEHFVPAIWIPDGKTDACMRCGRSFGWRRRRHHCRLCGRCVCASCSGKTFIISDNKQGEESHKTARACEACYETVFPLIDSPICEPATVTQSSNITTLSGFPSWTSVRVSALSTSQSAPLSSSSSASALMAIDLESPKRELTRIDDFDDEVDGFIPENGRGASPRVRIKAVSRPRSYHQILEDFERITGESNNDLVENNVADVSGSFASLDVAESSDELDSPTSKSRMARISFAPSSFRSSSSPKKKEDTARRRKRFSMPALAVQTTPVTARPNVVGEGKAKRISLILSSKSGESSSSVHLPGESKNEADRDGSGHGNGHDGDGHIRGVAAGKLSELLRRGQKV